jgi:hypothetical protein
MADELINKVASSGLVTIDLEAYFPTEEIISFDLKPHLYKELILKEKEFRESLQKQDWSKYRDQVVAIFCSADAIIPAWAYMLIATYLQPFAEEIVIGEAKEVARKILLKRIDAINMADYLDKRVIVKGCGDLEIDASAYLEITKKLLPVAKTIMYGEACSNVPVYKKK